MQKITYIVLSSLAGCTLQILANAAFWLLAYRPRAPKTLSRQALNRFYGAELLKWIIVIAGFSGIWLWGQLDPLAVFIGFFMPQLIYWKLLFSRKPQKLCLTRKTAA